MDSGADESPRSSWGPFPNAEEAAGGPSGESRLLEACNKGVNHHNYISCTLWRSSLQCLRLFLHELETPALCCVIVPFWPVGGAICMPQHCHQRLDEGQWERKKGNKACALNTGNCMGE